MIRLEVTGVSARYGRTPVLHDVTLPTLAAGEVLGLLGPNASGKSTLLRCLSREQPARGRIVLDGEEQRGFTHARWHAHVASMPQAPPAPSALLPIELMWSTARALSLPLPDAALAAKIESIFRSLGLEAVALTPLQTLSGGKRQLVGLALALLRQPRLLLLDEPTSALDLHWRLVVLDLLRSEISERGSIAVAALHDLELAARYCDRVALIDRGRIVAAGPPEEVLTAESIAQVYSVEANIRQGVGGRLAIDILRPIPRSTSTSIA